MKNQLLEKYIKSFLNEGIKSKLFDNVLLNIDKGDQSILASSIYKFMRKDDDDLDLSLDQITSVYNSTGKNFYDDLSKAIKDFHNKTTNANSTFQNGWFEISIPDASSNKSITIGNISGDQNIIGRRHNIYFTIRHKSIRKGSPTIKTSGFIDYFKDLSKAMQELLKESKKFNKENDCNIFSFKTYMISKATSLIVPKTKNINALHQFFSEADNLKIYLSGIDRKSSNIDKIKKDILKIVKEVFERNNFIIKERSRADFGYDYQAKSRSTKKETFKTSFGDVVAVILANKILSSEEIKLNIKKAGQQKFLYYLNQVEDFVSNPKNSTKVSRLIAKHKMKR